MNVKEAVIVAMFTATMQTTQAATINGIVFLQGPPPPAGHVDLTEFPEVAEKYPSGMTTRFYEVNADGRLQNVLLYLMETGPIIQCAVPKDAVPVQHIDGLFQPYVVGIQTRQPLHLTCKDGALCAFFVRTRRNLPFVTAPLGRVVVHIFSQPEPEWVRITCDMHPWNFAYLGVFDHPYFAVTDERGEFSIRDVPPGQYRIAAVHRRTHPDFKGIIKLITVHNEDIEVKFVIEP